MVNSLSIVETLLVQMGLRDQRLQLVTTILNEGSGDTEDKYMTYL